MVSIRLVRPEVVPVEEAIMAEVVVLVYREGVPAEEVLMAAVEEEGCHLHRRNVLLTAAAAGAAIAGCGAVNALRLQHGLKPLGGL